MIWTHALSLAVFAALFLGAGLLSAAARRAARRGVQGGQRPATFTEAIASTMTTRAGKAVVLGTWWWLGLHFLGR
jgi:Family of unknown function (DUF6186)